MLYPLGNVADAAAEENVQPGQIKTLRPDAAVKALDVINPSCQRETITRGPAGDFSYKNIDRVGVYEATWAAGPSRRQAYDIWKWIAVAALVLLILEWAMYYRRVFF